MAQIVIAWTLAQPGITFALCGARNPEQALDNARAGEIALEARRARGDRRRGGSTSHCNGCLSKKATAPMNRSHTLPVCATGLILPCSSSVAASTASASFASWLCRASMSCWRKRATIVGRDRPSRMVHGGVRYLENGEFKLVRESLLERDRLLKNAPHYVAPLPTTVPIFDIFSGLANGAVRFLG